MTQEIALSVKGDKVECAINGTVVGSYDKAAVVGAGKLKSTDGVYGIRFAHNTEATSPACDDEELIAAAARDPRATAVRVRRGEAHRYNTERHDADEVVRIGGRPRIRGDRVHSRVR